MPHSFDFALILYHSVSPPLPPPRPHHCAPSVFRQLPVLGEVRVPGEGRGAHRVEARPFPEGGVPLDGLAAFRGTSRRGGSRPHRTRL